MDGIHPAGSVSAIDHARNFKELLTTFFVDLLDLRCSKLARLIDPGSIEFLPFLPQGTFSNLSEGQKYVVDIVAKVRLKGEPAYFLVHVKHQSDAQRMPPRRMFR